MCDSATAFVEYSGKLNSTLNSRTATVWSILIIYIFYNAALGLKYLKVYKKEQREVEKFSQLANDIVYRSFFFYILALIIQVQVGNEVCAVFCYLYLATFIPLFIGYIKENFKIKLIALAAQAGLVLVIFFLVLGNPWCRYYFFRYAGNGDQVAAALNSGTN